MRQNGAMAYVIKRYANRKLYDTRTKRYLTLDEVAVIVRAGPGALPGQLDG